MAKVINWDFFPLRHDYFTHYKTKAIRKEFGNDGLVVLLCIWSYLQERGGFLDHRNKDLIEDLATVRAGVTAEVFSRVALGCAKPTLDLLREDPERGLYNAEILERLGKMHQLRQKAKEDGRKGGLSKAAKSKGTLSQPQGEPKATLSRGEESRELPLGNSNTIRSTTNLTGDDTKSERRAPERPSVLLWSPETKIADFIGIGFGLSHTDLGKATKQYEALSPDVKKLAFEKASKYLETYAQKYPNTQPSLTAYFQLEIWKR